MHNYIRKIAILISLLVLLSQLAFASEYWPELSYHAKINVSIIGKIKLKDAYGVSYVKANVSMFPRNDSWHRTLISESPVGKLTEGNIIFKWEYPEDDILEYKVSALVDSEREIPKISEENKFPVIKLEEGYSKYLAPYEKVKLGVEFSGLASEITKGSSSLFEAASRISYWVSKNVKYDAEFGSAVYDSKWVLENRRGTCDEFATLFIALCRAVGIPARYVAGIAYSNLEGADGFESHAWAEVYFPTYGWVPFDPTYNQHGYVDVSHIPFIYSEDSAIIPAEYAMMAKAGTFSAERLNISASVVNRDNFRDELQINLSPEWAEVCLSSYDVLVAEVYNPNNYYVARVISISRSDALILESEREVLVVLAPFEKKKIYWLVRTYGLERQFIYSIPVRAYLINDANISSATLIKAHEHAECISEEAAAERIKKIKDEVPERYDSEIILNCQLSKIYINENATATCSVKNVGNAPAKGVVVCSLGTCHTLNLSIMEEFRVKFPLNSSGLGNFSQYITITKEKSSARYRIDYEVIERPSVKINISKLFINKSEILLRFEIIPQAGMPIIKKVAVSDGSSVFFSESFNSTFTNYSNSIRVSKKIMPKGNSTLSVEVFYEDLYGYEYSEKNHVEVYIEKNFLEEVFNKIASCYEYVRKIIFYFSKL
ncbi:MAG: transglutaminase-like domain-containing protein [Candidatus Woesearchaeota archaeon]